jgi:AcrR family transcriptional regulator
MQRKSADRDLRSSTKAQISRKPIPVKADATMRRQPKQRRSRQTVEAVLDAVVRVLKRDGVDGVTTNRIAEVAGVSVGSVYQYFPDKRAIFTALHDRHVEEISRLIDGKLVEHATSSLEEFVRALVEALVDAHASDPEFHQLMTTAVPHGADGARALDERLRSTFRLAISARSREGQTPRDLDRVLFVLPSMVEALSHGAAYRRPPRLSLGAAKEEAVRAVLAYLRS